MTLDLIETAAKAIREVTCRRIWACSYPGVKPPIEWDKLKEEHREGYRDEARAAFDVFTQAAMRRSQATSVLPGTAVER